MSATETVAIAHHPLCAAHRECCEVLASRGVDGNCICGEVGDLIAERDRARATAVRLEQECDTAYQSGRDDAAQAVIDYAHATHEAHDKRTTCPRCDITAALIVAAQFARGES